MTEKKDGQSYEHFTVDEHKDLEQKPCSKEEALSIMHDNRITPRGVVTNMTQLLNQLVARRKAMEEKAMKVESR